jgi:hypothetical protein
MDYFQVEELAGVQNFGTHENKSFKHQNGVCNKPHQATQYFLLSQALLYWNLKKN